LFEKEKEKKKRTCCFEEKKKRKKEHVVLVRLRAVFSSFNFPSDQYTTLLRAQVGREA
jgi:hypothetical protein